MKAVGIIVEYNPFHNGHIRHLKEIKKKFQDYIIIAVMSGNFTERGDMSIIDKWEKTDLALLYGIDLVIELPFVFATQGADIFAKASIEILSALKVDYLVFGSESNNIKKLTELAQIQIENPKYEKLVQQYLKQGINYPSALSKALLTISKKTIKEPNDILGMTYVREIIKQESKIQPVTIKRNTDYNSIELNDHVTSATSIRYALKNHDDVSSYVPEKTLEKLHHLHFNEAYFPFLKYKIITDHNHLASYQTVEEGIENRLYKAIIDSNTWDEFILKVKTKRYTYNKISRMLIHILCNFTKEEAKACPHPTYIRVLGFNMKGRNYLNIIKDKISLPIITKFSDLKNEQLRIEYRSTCVYNLLYGNEEMKKEYKMPPIIR